MIAIFVDVLKYYRNLIWALQYIVNLLMFYNIIVIFVDAL